MADTHRLVTRDGRVSVTVLRYGLTIHAIHVKVNDRVYDVLAGPEDPKGHSASRQFFGPVIGRYANRLPAGSSESHGVTVDLEAWGGMHVHHHGGPPAHGSASEGLEQRGPWDTVVWTQVHEPHLFPASDLAAWDDVGVWAIESPDGDQGYPGRLRVEACVGVRAGPADLGDVHVEYRARLLDTCKATPLNMTQHWGFRLPSLSECTEGQGVLGHTLQLGVPDAPLERLALDAQGVPTGELIPCTDAAHDWRPGKQIGTAMPQGGYDHFYVWGPSTARVARLQGAGLCLDITTNQTGVQLYTANEERPLDEAPKCITLARHTGRTVPPFSSFRRLMPRSCVHRWRAASEPIRCCAKARRIVTWWM